MKRRKSCNTNTATIYQIPHTDREQGHWLWTRGNTTSNSSGSLSTTARPAAIISLCASAISPAMRSNSGSSTSHTARTALGSDYVINCLKRTADSGSSLTEATATLTALANSISLLHQWHLAIQRDAKDATAIKSLMLS
jgi:hypothetical protein